MSQHRHLTVLVKPASSLCNLRCRYCFYHSLAKQRETASFGVMPDDTVNELIEKSLTYAQSVSFAFQGGEPTVAGLPFFRRFTDEVDRQNVGRARVQYSLQTNGVALTEEYCEFLRDRRYMVGLSLDGPKDIHDAMRVDAKGRGTFRPVMDAVRLLEKAHVEYNILCTVNATVARHIEQVYRFFRKQGFQYLQFIPCIDPLDAPPFSEKHSLNPETYARFLIRLFELWAYDIEAGQGVSIRFFDNLLQVAAGYPAEQCGMLGCCPGQFVVEADGTLYPCDFYCVDNWKIGNIRDMTIEEAAASPVMGRFIATSQDVRDECRQCQWYALCRGGCRRDRDPLSNGSAGPNLYCEALKQFYAVATPRLPRLLARF